MDTIPTTRGASATGIKTPRLIIAGVGPAIRYGLTPRESEIVGAIVNGASNKDISASLSISVDTVKHHLASIFDKTGVGSRLELAVFSIYHGLASFD